MRQYLLFAGRSYYPNGGINDYQGSFDDIDEAYMYFLKNEDQESWDWYHIIDKETLKTVKE